MSLLRRFPIVTFFVATLGVQTLSVWAEYADVLPSLLIRLRVYQPALIAIAMMYWLDGKPALVKLGKSLIKVRLHWRWYAFAILYAPVLGVLPQVGWRLAGLTDHIEYEPAFLTINPWFFKFVITVAVVEEISWVSFGVSRLAKWYSPFLAGVIGGIPWGLYYVPLNEAGIQVAGQFPNFPMVVNFMAISAVCAWLYFKTGSAILVALMQTEVNYASLTFPVLPREGEMMAYYVFVALKWVLAIVLFHFFGPGHLFSRPKEEVAAAPSAQVPALQTAKQSELSQSPQA